MPTIEPFEKQFMDMVEMDVPSGEIYDSITENLGTI